LVPRHWLGEHIDEQFRAHGLSARVYRGLSAPDPSIVGNMERPKDKQEQMCLAREKRELAEALRKSVSTSCCAYKKQRCEFHPEGKGRRKCGYQMQQLGEQPDVWIAAHNMLFHPQKAFGKPAGIVIDEGFIIRSGVYGIGKKKDDEIPGMLLEDIANDNCDWRQDLLYMLECKHPLGGVRADRIDMLDKPLKYYTGKEWEIVNSIKLTPEMSPAQIKEIRESEAAAKCRRARWMAGTWPALFELLKNDKVNLEFKQAEGNKNLWLAERKKDGNVAVSGRLTLAKNKAGKLVLQRRGIHPVVKSRQVPTFLMDATLPGISILRAFFPQIREENITRLKVTMPEHVHVTQVLGAPTTELKLWGRDNKAQGKNREDVKRFILQWWLEDDRRAMLVVCQQKYERWLRDNLPKEIVEARRSKGELSRESKVIAIEHFNNVSGLDRYKNVSSILLIGRIQPSPQSVEAYAGALTGSEPAVKIPPPAPGMPHNWFKQVPRAIRMKDGTGGVVVERCDFHPDPMCEDVRKMLCEGEMIQSLGRARAINRDAPEKALRVGLVNDVVLDLSVDRVLPWTVPSEVVEPLALDGLVLTAEQDMAKGWPHIWKSADAAKATLKKLRAAARRGGKGFQGFFSSVYLILEKKPRNHSDATLSSARAGASTEDISSSIATVQYQVRRGRGQRFREAIVDLRIWPSPREGLVKKLGGTFTALLQRLFPRHIPPMAGAGKVAVVDRLVRILRKARYTLSADVRQHKVYAGVGRPGRYVLSKDPHLVAYDGRPGGITTPHVDAYSALPIELRMRALGLHESGPAG
jgi:hypothetical protein